MNTSSLLSLPYYLCPPNPSPSHSLMVITVNSLSVERLTMHMQAYYVHINTSLVFFF